ncbi:SOS response-associated peptidase [Nocardioides sp. SYSU DS0651]|uniref:SOS response-associated peptidase n=1 Tax=Nocardioides sp. SYSU DS0651 TaxID=3415955 RepID=UPI003F4C2A18
MCGRYASSRSPEDLAEEFEVLDPRLDRVVPPSYNVAPTDDVYAVLERSRKDAEGRPLDESVRQLRVLRWGLVPSWAKDQKIGSRMINARMETVAEKPAFRRAFAARRCILPADGYFEWYETQQRDARGKRRKQPFFIRPEDGSVLAMAGLYEIWRNPAAPPEHDHDGTGGTAGTAATGGTGGLLWTCTVITTQATDQLGRIHDRMPLVVDREARDRWLDPRSGTDDLLALLRPAQQAGLTAYPVSTAVGNVANDGPELVEPIPLDDPDGLDGDSQETLL